MKHPVYSSRFKRDVRQIKSRGKDLDKLWTLAGLLLEGTALSSTYQDHALKGRWRDYRDAHIEPDWLLIYRPVGTDIVLFERTGRHSDLFDE